MTIDLKDLRAKFPDEQWALIPEFCMIKKNEMEVEIKIEIKNLKSKEIESAIEKRL